MAAVLIATMSFGFASCSNENKEPEPELGFAPSLK